MVVNGFRDGVLFRRRPPGSVRGSVGRAAIISMPPVVGKVTKTEDGAEPLLINLLV